MVGRPPEWDEHARDRPDALDRAAGQLGDLLGDRDRCRVPQDQVRLIVDQSDFHLARGGLLRVRVRGRRRIQFVDRGGDRVRVDPEFAQHPGRHAVLRPQLDDTPWVTLAKAEAATGVSRSALRSWYRNGEIQSRLVDGPNGPQRLVQLDAVIERAAVSPRIQRRAEREVSLEAQVTLLRHRVDQLELRLAALERK
ncbi:MAG: hypothetical protein QOG76_8389 [Pseudonocardiales bacterium]|nr:hypothetical protein [Pseudonocardiales bacterium]